MLLAHSIRLAAAPAQCDYFARAAGTARRVWNWALAEWQRQIAAGLRPDALALKKQFNAIKYAHPDWLDADGRPWLRTIHRDAHAQPFAHLGKAWIRYFAARKAGQQAYPPGFKKKGRCRDSFYVANDKFRIEGSSAVLPKVGRVALAEALRFPGKIMGATISRQADHWFLSIQVEVPDGIAERRRTNDGVAGVDLGVSAAATLSTGEKIAAPRPLRSALRRLRIRARRQSRKVQAAKAAAGIAGGIPKGTRLQRSANQVKGALRLACLHARIARVRADFTHKLTTRLCRRNQAVAIEDLHVKGMLANARLARSIADAGFHEIRRQLQYKALRYGTVIVLADRWYPSSKLCSACGQKNGALTLAKRVWTCSCGVCHERDVNAAINLQGLATGALAARTALPVASQAATPDTAAGMVPAAGGGRHACQARTWSAGRFGGRKRTLRTSAHVFDSRCAMKTILAALLASAALSANAGRELAHQVDLDTPGALAQVEQDNPAHYRAITEILREAPYRRPQTLSGWVRTAFDARMASAMLIKTSYPPRARLEFVLDNTEYRAFVTLRNVEPSLTPLVRRPSPAKRQPPARFG